MGRPTKEQLEKINRLSKVELTEDDVYVFHNLMIDNAVTSYYTIVHENLLRKFSVDVKKGVGLILSHDSSKLPIGRSFDSTLVEEWDEETGEALKSLYGDFYIALGRNTESGMTTDDIVRGIDSGTIFATSIGFSAKTMKCSICGHDIRSWDCPHWPGKEYIVENEEGVGETVTCCAIIGEDGVGELIENSLVYAGACSRASIVNEYSKGNDSVTKNLPKLQVVEELKQIPVDASIYQFYTAGGLVLMTDSTEKRSETGMDRYKKVLTEFNIQSEDELKAKLTELSEKSTELENKDKELLAKDEEIAKLTEDLEYYKKEVLAKNDEVSELKDEITELNEEITNLTQLNEELKQNAELIEVYKKDLKDEILELGVRSQGNAFNKTLFERFLDTLSIEELKEVRESFDEEVKTKFSNVRVSQTKVKDKKKDGELYREDLETEEEFRVYIADLAERYAKENNVSLKEATKLMYEKYSERSED